MSLFGWHFRKKRQAYRDHLPYIKVEFQPHDPQYEEKVSVTHVVTGSGYKMQVVERSTLRSKIRKITDYLIFEAFSIPLPEYQVMLARYLKKQVEALAEAQQDSVDTPTGSEVSV